MVLPRESKDYLSKYLHAVILAYGELDNDDIAMALVRHYREYEENVGHLYGWLFVALWRV